MTQGTDAFVQILKSHKLKGPSCSIKTNEVVSKNKRVIRISNVVVLLFYFHNKHLRSCRDGQLT